MKPKAEVPEELYTDLDANSQVLTKILEREETQKTYERYLGPEENKYVQMLQLMEKAKQEEDQEKLQKATLDQALNDFQKEQEDAVEVEKAGFASDIGGGKESADKVHIKFVAPPRTSREAIKALQEAD